MVTFTDESLNGKLNFLCNLKVIWWWSILDDFRKIVHWKTAPMKISARKIPPRKLLSVKLPPGKVPARNCPFRNPPPPSRKLPLRQTSSHYHHHHEKFSYLLHATCQHQQTDINKFSIGCFFFTKITSIVHTDIKRKEKKFVSICHLQHCWWDLPWTICRDWCYKNRANNCYSIKKM